MSISDLIQAVSDLQHDLGNVASDISKLIKLEQDNTARLARIEQWMRNPSSAARQIQADERVEHEAIAKTFQCPLCRGPMTARKGKMGDYFAGCEGYPECHGSRSMRGMDTTKKPARVYNLRATTPLHAASPHAPTSRDQPYFDD